MRDDYRFVLELRAFEDGRVLHHHALAPDWEPAVEAARLAGLRQHGVWFQPGTAEPQLVPVWHEAAGEPLVRGVRVRLAQDGRAWDAEIPSSPYFADVARALVSDQVTEGRLQAGDRVRYAVCAYGPQPETGVAALPFAATERPQPVRIRDRGFGALVQASAPMGDEHAEDMAVVVPEHVLDEVCALTTQAGERETGGILLGHLCRVADGDVGVEVTAHVPARHTEGDAVKLTFTSDTWTDVRAAVALRRADELLVGWWHSHPAHAWCKKCPVERQRVCELATGFLSADDRALHRTMFPGAYTQALVVTHSAAGLDTRLFGWRGGVLQPRGFLLHAGDAAHAGSRASFRVRASTGGEAVAACADATSAAPVGAIDSEIT